MRRPGVETLEAREVLSGTTFNPNLPYVTFMITKRSPCFDAKPPLSSSDAGIRQSYHLGSAFNPGAWPAATDHTLATLFRIYGFTGSAVGDAIPDATLANVTYTVRSDQYGNYIELDNPSTGKQGPATVNINIDLLQTTLPDHDVPGIALDQQTRTVTGIGTNPQGYKGTSGLADSIGVPALGPRDGPTVPHVRRRAKMTIVNPGGPSLLTYTNDNFEGKNKYGYLDYDANGDALRLNDVIRGINTSAPAGSQENTANLIRRENYAVPAGASADLYHGKHRRRHDVAGLRHHSCLRRPRPPCRPRPRSAGRTDHVDGDGHRRPGHAPSVQRIRDVLGRHHVPGHGTGRLQRNGPVDHIDTFRSDALDHGDLHRHRRLYRQHVAGRE